MAEITTELYELEAMPAPDDLIAGSAFLSTDGVKVAGAGQYHRGEVLVKSGDTFVRCAPSALYSAEEVCLSSLTFELEEDAEMKITGYFMGHYNMRRIYVGGLKLSKYDGKEQAAVMDALRRHKIFLH